MTDSVICLQGISKSFGQTPVLKGVTFSIAQGEKVTMMGPGGCGKSTILKIILGILEPDEGEVYLQGTRMDLATEDEKQATLKRVGMAFQQGALFDYMTVRENLLFAMEHMTDFAKEQMEDKVEMLLNGVKLGKTKNMFPHELSGGMQRRVGIARALATEATTAIFDEPTSGLDPVTSTIILNMINDLVGERADSTTLVCTTNVEIGIRYADRVILIDESGSVAADGPWRDLLVTGSDWVRHFLETRLIGLDYDYAVELDLPKAFVDQHW